MAVFYNGTNEDFAVTWNKFPYLFRAGQVYSKLAIADDGVNNVPLTDASCRVFAHHLAHKVLNTPSLDMNFRTNKEGIEVSNEKEARRVHNIGNLEILIQRFTTEPEKDVEIPTVLSSLPLFEEKSAESEDADVALEPVAVEEAPKKKMGRPPKAKSEESEFAM